MLWWMWIGCVQPTLPPPMETTCDCRFDVPEGFEYFNVDGPALAFGKRDEASMSVWVLDRAVTGPVSVPAAHERSLANIEVSQHRYVERQRGSAFVADGQGLHPEYGTVRTRSALFVGPRNFIRLDLSTPEAHWETWEPVLQQVLESFEVLDLPQRPWSDPPLGTPATKPLLASRLAHPTQAKPRRTATPLKPGPRHEVVRFETQLGPMQAMITPDPGDGARHPAVIWLAGGFDGPTEDMFDPMPPQNDQGVHALLEAGLVVMVPALRGQRGNPGSIELFFGETEDLHRAIAHVRSLPYVDPERVYLAGHSTGGTEVLLAAVSGAAVRASFVFGGRADYGSLAAEGGYGEETFDIKDPEEQRLRSAIHWAHAVEHPVFWFEGEQAFVTDGFEMARHAASAGRPMSAFAVGGGNHFNILHPLQKLMIDKIAKDTGAEPIRITEGEVYAATASLRTH